MEAVKGILCLKCTDWKALPRGDGVWTSCSCGNVRGSWVNGAEGRAQVEYHDLDTARVIGLHNGIYLAAKAYGTPENTPEKWRAAHELFTSECGSNYLFHTEKRNCWMVIIGPWESGDVAWRKCEGATRGADD